MPARRGTHLRAARAAAHSRARSPGVGCGGADGSRVYMGSALSRHCMPHTGQAGGLTVRRAIWRQLLCALQSASQARGKRAALRRRPRAGAHETSPNSRSSRMFPCERPEASAPRESRHGVRAYARVSRPDTAMRITYVRAPRRADIESIPSWAALAKPTRRAAQLCAQLTRSYTRLAQRVSRTLV